MAEEIRRSGRATKGQYTKDRDIAEEGPPTGKRKGNGKGSKGKAVEEEPEEEEDEKIRCICGQYDEEEEGRAMICCDNCEVWQHNDCMGLAEDYAPDKYYCEECHPEDHQDTVAALERGEKIWEIRKQAVEAEKASKKKGGKKGRKSAPRSSEVPSRASQDTEEAPLREAAGRGSKRKLEESTNEGDMKDIKKVRGTSTPAEKETKPASQRKSSSMNTPSRGVSRSETNFGPVVTDVNQLPVQRKGVAGGLIKTFVEQTNDAVKQDTYSVPSGSTTKEVGTQLALRVEHALYNVKSPGAPEPNEAYKEQFRSILFNVKNNPSLRDRLLRGEVTAEALASMDAKDMASEEQQRKDAETKKALEKQHTIIQEQGPRIRRTHKGEEYVNEADQVAAESTTSHAPVRRESMNVENDVQMQSPPSEPAPNRPRQLSVNTQGKPRASREPQRQSSTNFDINNVWSSVQGSPDAEHHQFPELPQRSPGGPVREAAGPGAGEDAEIDALLKDEDAESEPYSPKDYADGDDVIWRGVVNGNTLGRFHATAQYAAGCTPEALGLTYRELIPAELTISGRIDPSKADEYLCGLQYSTTSDVIVVSIRQPETPPDLAQFNKLFDYFKTRTRYGVAIQHSNPAIKDIYLIPLEVGQGVPELLKLLDNDKIPERITERLLMVPFVVKNTELPENSTFGAKLRAGDMPTTPTTQQTPITPYENQFDYQQQPPPGVPYSHPPSLPTHPQVSNGTPTPQPFPSHPHYNTPPPHYAPPGGTVAAQVLGPLAGAPAVLELLRQVPNADADQLSIVREICEQNPRAAQELPVLEQALRARGAPQ